MGKPRSHLLDIYDCWLHVATTQAQWAKLARRYELAAAESPGATYTWVDTKRSNQPHVGFWIDTENLAGRALVDTIAHEATHGAAQLLDHIGQRADRHDSEVLAYLVGWISGWLWEATRSTT